MVVPTLPVSTREPFRLVVVENEKRTMIGTTLTVKGAEGLGTCLESAVHHVLGWWDSLRLKGVLVSENSFIFSFN